MDTMSDPLLAIKIASSYDVMIAKKFKLCNKELRKQLNYVMYRHFVDNFFFEPYDSTRDYHKRYNDLEHWIYPNLTFMDVDNCDQFKYLLAHNKSQFTDIVRNKFLSHVANYNLTDVCETLFNLLSKEELFSTLSDHTVLVWAIHNQRNKIVEMLIKYGATCGVDINKRYCGSTPLSYAVAVGEENYGACVILLQAGAEAEVDEDLQMYDSRYEKFRRLLEKYKK